MILEHFSLQYCIGKLLELLYAKEGNKIIIQISTRAYKRAVTDSAWTEDLVKRIKT